MTSLPPVVVFDLDGTLLDTARDLLSALNAALAFAGQEPAALDRMRDYVGQGGAAMITKVFAERGVTLTDARRTELVDRFIDAYEAEIPGFAAPFPGALELVDQLRTAGYRTAICTNKFQRLTDALVDALAIRNRFDAVCGSDAFPVRKPDPGHLFGTIDQAGGDRSRAVMIGDSVTDIRTAQNARIPSVVVTFGYSDTPVETLGADLIIDRYGDLGVDRIEALIRS